MTGDWQLRISISSLTSIFPLQVHRLPHSLSETRAGQNRNHMLAYWCVQSAPQVQVIYHQLRVTLLITFKAIIKAW